MSLLLVVTGRLPLLGQSLSSGVQGGFRALDDFQFAATSQSRRYVVGPAVQVNLPLSFAIEFGALYRRQGYSASNGTALYASSIRESDNVWEFPLLARYRIPLHGMFADVGWAPRIMSGYSDESGSYLSTPATYTYYSRRIRMDWPATHGLVVGGGTQFVGGHMQFTPEVRYIRWNRQAVYGYFPDGPSYGSNQNQLDFMLGISWRIRIR